jgi:hypothetical protein
MVAAAAQAILQFCYRLIRKLPIPNAMVEIN